MEKPLDHIQETRRVKELESYKILDTLSEDDYDYLTAIASQICQTEISLISLLDDKRQWFKSNHGLDARETPKEFAFCAHAINDPEDIFIVENARKDKRFHDNPLVISGPEISFYAGVSLVSDNNLPLGTLCVIDSKPKTLSQDQKKSLKALGNQVMNLLNLRRSKLQLEDTLTELNRKNEELERFAYVAAHDLKSPLLSIDGLITHFLSTYGSDLDEGGTEVLSMISGSVNKLKNLIEGILAYSRCDDITKQEKSKIILKGLLNDISDLFTSDKKVSMSLHTDMTEIIANKTAIDQILINLIANAIKYNDKETTEIEIGITQSATHLCFSIKDNGPGIPIANQEEIFQMFKVLNSTDRFGNAGNGIGLATVKKAVENSGGTIQVTSELNEGAEFIFTLKK